MSFLFFSKAEPELREPDDDNRPVNATCLLLQMQVQEMS